MAEQACSALTGDEAKERTEDDDGRREGAAESRSSNEETKTSITTKPKRSSRIKSKRTKFKKARGQNSKKRPMRRMGPVGGAFFTLSTHLLAPFQAFKLILVLSPTLRAA